MKALLGDRLYISKSLPEFVEFASPDVNKASGLEFLADRLGFSRERTVAFGDGENDVELVEWAGYGVAVANAHDRVLAAADLVPVRRGGGRRAGARGVPRLTRDRPPGSPRRPEARSAPRSRARARPGVRRLLAADERWRALVPQVDEPAPARSSTRKASRRRSSSRS